MTLNFDSLKQAISALERSIAVAEKYLINSIDAPEPDFEETIKAGVIQNFEVAYEQCWKMVKRWLQINASESDEALTRKDLFRLAAKYELVIEPKAWFKYGDARNLTSHTYNHETALSVYDTAFEFVVDACFLIKQLENKND